MGTRGLTVVINKRGETKVAQYGQWDHYFNGQRITALEFLRKTNLEKFEKRLEQVRFANKKDEKTLEDFFKSIKSEDGWMTGKQSKKFHKAFPLLTRDHGAKILDLLMKSKGEVFLQDQTIFAADGLFCEYAYVIDLKKNAFEVYVGFGKKPLSKKDRFFPLQKKGSEYYPAKMVESFKLDNLPTNDEFLKKLEGKE